MAGYHDIKNKLGEDLARILGGWGLSATVKIKRATDSQLNAIPGMTPERFAKVRSVYPCVTSCAAPQVVKSARKKTPTLARGSDEKSCPECGAINKSWWSICQECNANLAGSKDS